MAGTATSLSDYSEVAVGRFFDPFRQGVSVPLGARVYPLGFPMEVKTNSHAILEAAKANWSVFPKLFDDPPIRLEIAVDEHDSRECPSTVQFRARKHLLLMLSDSGNFAVCDLERGFAFCWVTAATAKNLPWFRYFYLDTIAYLTLWSRRLTRIHAACVALDGRGVLLCGPSGAGKSCLAYSCARRGWTFITDEAVSLVRGDKDGLVLGKPQHFHFRDTARAILPELDRHRAVPNLAGKMTIEIGAVGVSTDFQCHVAAVVFLDRGADGEPRLAPLPKEEAWRRLMGDLPLFGEPVHEEHKRSIRRLLEVPVFELSSYDLDSGVRLLEPLPRGK